MAPRLNMGGPLREGSTDVAASMMSRGLMKFALRDSYHHGEMVDEVLELLEMAGNDKVDGKVGCNLGECSARGWTEV